MGEGSDSLFTTAAMAAVFAPAAHVHAILQFEAALARAEAAVGIIPRNAADAIVSTCYAATLDVVTLYQEAATAGTVAIPLARMLTERVGEEAGRFVHWGATSQDAIDTALVLQMRAGLDLLLADLMGVCAICAAQAEQHRRTLMAGRTLLQQALPIPFGLKSARWLALVSRQVRALRTCREQALALQFAGAAGTLAALGDTGLHVAERLAQELNLPMPELPWHAERDRVAQVATTLGITAGSMAKIATDLVLLAQTEVGEVAEGAAPGKGGSSAMPHKRNPVDATMALAAARLAIGGVGVVLAAMAQEHERGVGGWQAEWQAIPDLFRHTAGAISRVRSALDGLEVDAERMRANLDRSGGLLMAEALTMALAPQLGQPAAQRLVKEVASRVQDGITFHQAALDDVQIRAVLEPDAIVRTLDPVRYLGSADVLIDRALAAYRAVKEEG
jgi:3-carboxy-cis,cis-muconate cycloisomerase